MSPERLAETRACCTSVSRHPVNEAARIAEDLAAALTGTYPYDPLVRSLVSGRRILAMTLPPGARPEQRSRAAQAQRKNPIRLRPFAPFKTVGCQWPFSRPYAGRQGYRVL
jgi:hypothetical protein